MSYLTPLLADADMFKLILLVVVGLIYLVNYLVGGNGAKAQQRRPMKPEPRPVPRPRPRSISPRFTAQGPGSSSSDDVSELLRRAAEKRGQPARSAGPPPIEPEPTRRLVASLDDTSFGSLHSPENSPPTGSSVSDYVQQQLGNRAFDERHLSHLEQSESEFAAHTQQMFQHTVGHLATQTSAAADADAAPSPTTPPANPVAETVGALLADPRSLRQAVILNEILDRPVARW